MRSADQINFDIGRRISRERNKSLHTIQYSVILRTVRIRASMKASTIGFCTIRGAFALEGYIKHCF